MTEIPPIGSTWEHYNGIPYVVVLITNEKTKDSDKYPVTVVYQNIFNDTVWSRPLHDWHRSMTRVDEKR